MENGILILAVLTAGTVLGSWFAGRPRPRRQAGRERAWRTSDVILLVMGLFTLVFVVAMTIIFCIKDAVPDTLIQYTLGAGGVEALLLAGIKVSKVRAGEVSKEDDAEGP